MNPMAIVFVFGLLAGAVPVFGWYEWWAMREENAALKKNIELERKNVEIVTQYQDALAGVLAYYQRNPVRVRVKGCETSPGNPAPRAEDVVLTVGGYKGSDGEAAGR